jgi:hypothetical protein
VCGGTFSAPVNVDPVGQRLRGSVPSHHPAWKEAEGIVKGAE